MKVKVLTNSLAATDVVIAHSGYVRYRKRLLGAGLELYEQPPRLPREKIHVFGSRRASLHTKSVLVDGRRGFVGSFNFDPRSKSINTEMGLFLMTAHLPDGWTANWTGTSLAHSESRWMTGGCLGEIKTQWFRVGVSLSLAREDV